MPRTRWVLIAATFALFGCESNPRGLSGPEGDGSSSSAQAGAKPEMQAVLDAWAGLNPRPLAQLTPTQARLQPGPADAVRALLAARGESVVLEEVAKVTNRMIPTPGGEISTRIYWPEGQGPHPVIVYFHGGGWVLGSPEAYDASARALTNAAGAIVVSSDYRLAPEHRFPAATEDAFAVYRWVLDNARSIDGDPDAVAIAGESAGGNLAAVTCLMARDRGERLPVHQLLVYPVTDATMDTRSYREHAHARPLDQDAMRWFYGHYLADPAQGKAPYVSPLLAPDLSSLPPATIITAEIDPLRSEGQLYAEALERAGVDVRYRNFDGVTHEFFGMGAVVPDAKEAVEFGAVGLRGAFDAAKK